MKNLSQKLLAITPGTYEKMVLNHYHQWCEHHAWDETDLQKLLTSPALFNWWYSQYQKLELQFAKRAIGFFGSACKKVMKDYHTEHVVKMEHYYSKPLMRAARNAQPVTPQLN